MGEQPTKPTTGTWSGDARALLEMGASMTDARTLRGVLDELLVAQARVRELEGERDETSCMEACCVMDARRLVQKAADERIAELEATVARVRAYAGELRSTQAAGFGRVDTEIVADQLEAALGDGGKRGG